MASAAKLIEALATEIGWSNPTVEAYALELRRMSWWPKTKRGRGASSITVSDAAKLLLSILSDGPKSLATSENDGLSKFDGTGFFLRYANLGFSKTGWNSAIYNALCAEMGLTENALFLDFLTAILTLFVEGKADQIIRNVEKPFVHKWDYTGPELTVSIGGPFPTGTIEFYFADAFAAKLLALDIDPVEIGGQQSFVFLHQFYAWHDAAAERGEAVEHWGKLLLGVSEYTAKGLRFEKAFGGRELSACARVLSGDAD
ncbi:MAG: hypothetical protein V4712_04945 [Pseudomonadota bacterium]